MSLQGPLAQIVKGYLTPWKASDITKWAFINKSNLITKLPAPPVEHGWQTAES